MKGRSIALTLLRLGHRVNKGEGARSLVHQAGLLLAAFCVVLGAWLPIATYQVGESRDARLLDRSPVAAQSADDTRTIAWFRETTDIVNGIQFSVIALSPTKLDAPPPPGLPHWPEPGEAFLSPSLNSTGDSLQDRYGRLGGTVGEAGLADLSERIVFYRPPVGSELNPDSATPITGFGTGSRWVFINQTTDYKLQQVIAAMFILLIVPALVMVFTAVRSGAERRDMRLAMLRALGASRRDILWVLIGEAARPVALGAVAGVAVAFLSTVVNTSVPLTSYVVSAGDLAPLRILLPVLGVASMVAVAVAVVFANIRDRRRRSSSRPRVTSGQIRQWPWLLLVTSAALATWGAFDRSSLGHTAFFAGAALTLVSLPVVTGWLSNRVGLFFAAVGSRLGNPSLLVGGRWLANRPAAVARVATVFIVGLGVAVQLQVALTIVTEATGTSKSLEVVVGDHLVSVIGQDSQRDATQLAKALGDERVLKRFQSEVQQTDDMTSPADASATVLVGSCAALRTFGDLVQCPVTPVALEDAYRSFSRLGTALTAQESAGPDSSTAVSSVEPADMRLTRMVVTNTAAESGIAQIKETSFAVLAAPAVEVPREMALVAPSKTAKDANWLLVFGLGGVLILVLSGALSAANVFVLQTRELGPLSSFRADRPLYLGISSWNLAFPLALAGVTGAMAAGLLGVLLTKLQGLGHVSIPFLMVAVAVAAFVALIVGLACGEAATRAARSWRPTAE